ncbi:hypothetical protein GGS23DRAFT_551402 [Durotheca rogersii]|uniref:uncharacterized protein n=1 Tax=Durotheca rogersii TaxID=419775 RepID=UPI00221F26E1|nr:uncharacterized protein GGS23DRAFT_551402 [Durotheca rogersii]KAI5866643.1 hypothetical protein GGS23DRAFT_551402 [Durotheca rogersii]
MERTQPPRIVSGGRLYITRHPGLAAAAVVAAGLVAAVRYQRSALTRNELAQKQRSSPDQPNFYVSVDRSGGGI